MKSDVCNVTLRWRRAGRGHDAVRRRSLLRSCAGPLAVAALAAAALAAGHVGRVFAADSDSGPPAIPRAIEAGGDSIKPPDFLFQPGDWDSITAAYDKSLEKSGRGHVSPEVGLRYDKAEGVHIEAGASASQHEYHISHIEGRFGYDTGRERPNGLARLLLDITRGERFWLELLGHDGIRPFGNHDPYGNTILALVAGYDARQYLYEREGSVSLRWRFTEERQASVGWVRTLQRPVRPVADMHAFGDDTWMERNEAADRILESGVRFRFERRPPYLGETLLTGLVVAAQGTLYGGALLGDNREFSRTQADLWYTRPIRHGHAWHVRGSVSLATGRAPRQARVDLGGAAGLKAFSPRGIGTPDTLGGRGVPLTGTTRAFLRGEFQRSDEVFKKSRVPVVKKLGVKLVPFAEVGAVWGNPLDEPILRVEDLRAPRRSEIRWDLGFGLRRDINYTGLLSHMQLDFAWPMGRDTGPPRIMLTLSSNGLD